LTPPKEKPSLMWRLIKWTFYLMVILAIIGAITGKK
jgi:hypothetical protein